MKIKQDIQSKKSSHNPDQQITEYGNVCNAVFISEQKNGFIIFQIEEELLLLDIVYALLISHEAV